MRLDTRIILAAAAALLATPAASAKGTGQSLPVQQGSLYYETIGQGDQPPLILLNGGPGSSHGYMHNTPVWDSMARNHRLVYFDQRATGRSTSAIPTEKITIDLMVSDLEALRVKLGAPKISLLGHSFGGFLAMAYATRHPDRVHRLILVGSGSPKLAANEYIFDKLYPDLLSTTLPEQDDTPAGKMGCKASTLPTYDRMSYYDQRNNKRDRNGSSEDDEGFSEATCTAVMLDSIDMDLFPAIAKLRIPTLVLNGRFDANVAPTVAFAISKAIPGSKLTYFERSGHTPFVEEPEAFQLAVEHFLDD